MSQKRGHFTAQQQAPVVRRHHNISVITGEEVDFFALAKTPQAREARKK